MSENKTVTLEIDGKTITVDEGTSIYDAAQKNDVYIPILCHQQHMTPVAVCRVCTVEIEGEWKLSPACYRPCSEGLKVHTHATSDKVRTAITVLSELLLADHEVPREAHTEYGDNELVTIAKKLGIEKSRFPKMPRDRGHDESSVTIAVDHNACILCDRCVRGCGEIRNNHVIGRTGKGYRARIAFDLDDPMGDSSCVQCGECMVSCPTGALTNRIVVDSSLQEQIGKTAEEIELDDLASHPLFEGVSKQFLGWNKESIVRRHFKKGEIICREGEYGSTAFIIEKGKVEVYLNSEIKHARAREQAHRNKGFFGMMKRLTGLASRTEDKREEEGTAHFIHVDAPKAIDLNSANPVAELTPDDLIFGEMTCMNNYPRSATVRATEDTTVLEVLRNVLYILQRNKKSKAKLDDVYRRRAIDDHLRSVPIFAELAQDKDEFEKFVSEMREKVELERLSPGDVVFRQGELADDFFLVRVGFVKVSVRQPGGDHVLAYIGPGGFFGEIGLLSDLPELAALAPAGERTATCTSLDHLDLIRIKGEDFQAIISRYPQIKEKLIAEGIKRLKDNDDALNRNKSQQLGEFVQQGLMEAQSLLVLDLEKCTRCDECTKACSDAHDGVTRLIREGLRFENHLVASSCRSCLDPYCMVGCPVGSIRRRSSREIIIEDWCIGCGKCSENCPYGNINMHPFEVERKDPDNPSRMVAVTQQKATTCDLCTDLDGQPSCVYACPHDAAHRMRGEDLLKQVQRT